MMMCFSLLIANTGYTIPGTNNTDGYEIDNTPALIVGLTVALVLILSITAPLHCVSEGVQRRLQRKGLLAGEP